MQLQSVQKPDAQQTNPVKKTHSNLDLHKMLTINNILPDVDGEW